MRKFAPVSALASALLAGLLALAANAEVAFEAKPGALPAPHIYEGGWTHFVGGGVAIFDCNADLRPDLFVAGGTAPARLYVNSGGAEIAFDTASVPGPVAAVTGAYPLDFDSDGHTDLMVLRAGENHVLRGLGDCRFEVPDWGLSGGAAWSTAFSATWEPGRDWPTLAIGNYVDRANPEGPFEACDAGALYRPRPNGGGYDAPSPLEPGFCALSMLFSDRGGDGPADLRISNDRHYYVRGGHEQLLQMPDLRWTNENDGWQNISIWGMGIASRDITGDALPDVVLTSMGDQLMQIAQPGGFYRAAPFSIGTYAQRPFIGDDGRPSTGWHAEFADVNNDGRDDLFIAKGNVDQMPSNAMNDPNNLLIQQPGGTFAEVADRAGVASTRRGRGAGLADFDGDGRLDLVVVNRRAPVEIYRNLTEESGNWLRIVPRQPGANRDAIGGWLQVRIKAGVQSREITIGGGHVSGQLLPQHFGLGPAQEAEVRIRWPGGDWSDWTAVRAGRTIEATAKGRALTFRPLD